MAASASTRASRVTARTSTSSEHRSGTTLGRVPPAMTPTLIVTPGQRPLSAWSSVTIRAASRIALRPFSGSMPAWAARPMTVMARPRLPLRDETMSPFARAHSRTRQASTPSASPPDVRGRGGRTDLLVRVGDEHEPRQRQPTLGLAQRRDGIQPGQQAALHVGDAGAGRDAVLDPERASGRRSRVEHGVEVADAQQRGPVRVIAGAIDGDHACHRDRRRRRAWPPRRQAREGVPPSSDRPRPRPPWCSCRSRC